jgi:hypothetical protein
MTSKIDSDVKNKLVGYYVPQDLLEKFRAAAKTTNRKMSAIVTELIQEWVAKQGK